jgi:hypothetical protein
MLLFKERGATLRANVREGREGGEGKSRGVTRNGAAHDRMQLFKVGAKCHHNVVR